MLSEDFHLSDQEMLLAADGELPTRRPLKFAPTSPPAGTAARGWRKSKRRLPISRELTARLSILSCHPSTARAHS